MRTKSLSIVAVLALAGCSLAYNGSRFQGGADTDTGLPGVDTGVPTDAPGADGGTDTGLPGVDTGVPIDGGTDGGPIGCHSPGECTAMGTYCDGATATCVPGCDSMADCAMAEMCNVTTHVCGMISCTGDAMCPMDTFCSSGVCADCDHDGDHYFSADATALRCARSGHADGGDCRDDMAAIYPFARADCSTALVESCTLPIAIMPMGATVTEAGITDEHVLWRSVGTALRVGGRRIGMVLGDDMPTLPSGAGNGFVGFIGNSGMRNYSAVPYAVEGAPGTAETLFSSYDVADAALGLTDGDGNSFVGLAVAGSVGSVSTVSYGQAVHARPTVPFGSLTSSSFMAPQQLFGGGRPAVAIADWLNHPGAVTLLDPGMGLSPTAINITPTVGHQTGGANAFSGTWMTGQGAAVMWMASDSSVAVWNGGDAAISPPTINLSAYTGVPPGGGNPLFLNVDYRGSLARAYANDGTGVEHFIAAVPIATTATPPQGRIVLLRWSYTRPVDTSQHTNATIPMNVTITELTIGTGFQPNAGVAVFALDPASAVIAYVERGSVVMRPLTTRTTLASGSTENPDTLTALHLAGSEQVLSLVVDAGLYRGDPRFPTGAVGRMAVTAMVQLSPSTWELRTRALEACIAP